MRNAILFTFLLFGLMACKGKTTQKAAQAVPDNEAIANSIHSFYAWYETFVNDAALNIDIVDSKGSYSKIDPIKQEQLFKNLRASGLLSEEFLENEKAFASECAAFWKSRGENGNDSPLTGMDYDHIFCGQDWDANFFKTAPVAIENLAADQAKASMTDRENKHVFNLKKENGKWLIAKITCPGGNQPLDYSGVYKSPDEGCPMELKIVFKENGYTYFLKEGQKQHKGKLQVNNNSEGQTYLLFKGLFGSKPKHEVEALVDGEFIRIQNSGNAANPYLVFKDCDMKYIELAKTAENAPVTHSVPSKISGEEKEGNGGDEGVAKTEKPDSKKKATAKIAKSQGKTSVPTLTLNQKGDITLNGKPSDLENLRKDLQKVLLANAIIPEEIPLKTVGETGMGMRAEINTIVNESVAGAKWVRKRLAIEALNVPVGKKLGTATQLEIKNYTTSGIFAFIDAKPLQANGQAVDYSQTAYKKEAASDAFADRVFGLLKFEKGTWKVLIFTLGSDKMAADVWAKKFGAPKSLFGK